MAAAVALGTSRLEQLLMAVQTAQGQALSQLRPRQIAVAVAVVVVIAVQRLLAETAVQVS